MHFPGSTFKYSPPENRRASRGVNRGYYHCMQLQHGKQRMVKGAAAGGVDNGNGMCFLVVDSVGRSFGPVSHSSVRHGPVQQQGQPNSMPQWQFSSCFDVPRRETEIGQVIRTFVRKDWRWSYAFLDFPSVEFFQRIKGGNFGALHYQAYRNSARTFSSCDTFPWQQVNGSAQMRMDWGNSMKMHWNEGNV